jgi:hypothetical protein
MTHSILKNIFTTALMISCIFLCACENDIEKVKNLSLKKTGIEEARMVKLNYTLGGKKKAILIGNPMLSINPSTSNQIKPVFNSLRTPQS